MAYIAVPKRTNRLRRSEAPKTCDWVLAHEALSRLAKGRAQLEWEEGRGLLAALRASVHRYLGFASFAQYIGVLFGYKPRSIEEKLRVAEALQALPLLSEDLRTGTLSWSAVRELTRVARRETESAWREVAQGKSVREIEDCVSGRKPGDTPDSPADPALRRHVLAFEVRAETLATFREALANLRRDAGGPLDEEAALLLMARQVLGGPTDTGRANYQIALTLCEHCGRGFQHGRGERFEIAPEVVNMARCDAQYIGRVDSIRAGSRQRAERSTALKPALLDDEARALVRCSDDETSFSAHAGDSPNDHTPSNDDTTQAAAHVGDALNNDANSSADRASIVALRGALTITPRSVVSADPSAPIGTPKPRRPNELMARATQTIPPATRRLVRHRDGARCVVPGCQHATFLDMHHLELRSEGGSHAPESLVVLCGAHHRAIHRGALIVDGNPVQGLVFRHADGSVYPGTVSPRSVAAQTRAFAALRRLGFREGEVRRALDRLRTEVGLDAEDPQQVVRAALRLLTPAPVTGSPSAS